MRGDARELGQLVVAAFEVIDGARKLAHQSQLLGYVTHPDDQLTSLALVRIGLNRDLDHAICPPLLRKRHDQHLRSAAADDGPQRLSHASLVGLGHERRERGPHELTGRRACNSAEGRVGLEHHTE